MQGMMDFVTWFISQLPGFLLSEPISAFTGLAISAFVIRLIQHIFNLGKGGCGNG